MTYHRDFLPCISHPSLFPWVLCLDVRRAQSCQHHKNMPTPTYPRTPGKRTGVLVGDVLPQFLSPRQIFTLPQRNRQYLLSPIPQPFALFLFISQIHSTNSEVRDRFWCGFSQGIFSLCKLLVPIPLGIVFGCPTCTLGCVTPTDNYFTPTE